MENVRKRRTKEDLGNHMTIAATTLIEQKGFEGVTLTAIAQKAKIEPRVFYNRYNDLYDFFSEYVKKYDYWFSEIFENYPGNLYTKEGYKSTITELFHSLSDNKGMQQLLRWELSSNNHITQRTAKLREFHTIPLASKFNELFKDTQLDIEAASALLIGGIYYLILHKDLAAFSNIDINSEEGKDRIVKTINYIVNIFFSELESNQETLLIGKKMKQKGISVELIRECTGLSTLQIDTL